MHEWPMKAQVDLNGAARRTRVRSVVAGILHLEPDDPAPVYVQLERQIRVAVADGVLEPGDHLPSVRATAKRLGVSNTTVARAYAELAREGVLVSRAGGGSMIAPRESLDQPALTRLRQERLHLLARQVAVRSLALGMQPTHVIEAVAREFAVHGRPVPAEAPNVALGSDEAVLLSARNRFKGTVTGIRAGELVAEVTVRLAEGVDAVAIITRLSLERLGLRVGGYVSVHVKATELVLAR